MINKCAYCIQMHTAEAMMQVIMINAWNRFCTGLVWFDISV